MRHEKSGVVIELIDEPKQRHIVAWEQAVQAQKTGDAQRPLQKAIDALDKIRVTDTNVPQVMSVFAETSIALGAAMTAIKKMGEVTVSQDYGMMVRAAITAGWITFPESPQNDVDDMDGWVVKWIAALVRDLYIEVNSIPKN